MARRASSNSGAVGLTMVVSVDMELLQSVEDLHWATAMAVLLGAKRRRLARQRGR